MLGRSDQIQIVSQCPCAVHDDVARRVRGTGRAAEQPQITTGRFAHDGPGIVVRVIQNPIIPDVEGAEEGDLQLGVLAARNDLGLAFGSLLRAGNTPLSTGVQHADPSVFTHGILGGDAFTAAFEAVFVTSNLIPEPGVALEIDGLGRLRNRRVADRPALQGGAGPQGQGAADEQERKKGSAKRHDAANGDHGCEFLTALHLNAI